MIFWNIASSWKRKKTKIIDLNNKVIQSNNINIVCLWDSNTVWKRILLSQRYPYRLESLWGDIKSVYNEWLSWDTASWIIWRIDSSLYSHKVQWYRNIATILIWRNDFVNVNKTVEDIWNDIQSLISLCINDWWEVSVMTYSQDLFDLTINWKIKLLNGYIRDNENLWYTLIDNYTLFVDWNDAMLPWILWSDNIHLTALWNDIIFNNIKLCLNFE